MITKHLGTCVRRLAAALMVAAGAVPAVAQAQTSPHAPPLVVELYTSQGCSACPPADALLHELAKRDDVIALALHVDYWDYIGWKDVFARPEHAVRQKAYARAAGERMIYTPQMVLGGVKRVVGAEAMAIMSAIDVHRASTPAVDLVLRRQATTVLVELAPLTDHQTRAIVQLVRFRPEDTAEISRGENAGKTLRYTNIVTAWDVVAEWDGASPKTVQLPVEGDDPAVVIVQAIDHGPVLAARRVE